MKLAQLMLNDGKWAGKADPEQRVGAKVRIGTAQPVSCSAVRLALEFGQYPYNGRKVRGFFAGGNGGQVFMAIPDLDLVIAFHGGNYAQSNDILLAARFSAAKYILPAVH